MTAIFALVATAAISQVNVSNDLAAARLAEAMEQYSDHLQDGIRATIVDLRKKRAAGRISEQVFKGDSKQLQIRLRSLKEEPYRVPSLYLWTLRTGQIGRLSGNYVVENSQLVNRFQVVQVVDSDTILIESLDKDAFVADTGETLYSQRALVLVDGVSTRNMINGAFVELPQIFEVTGTQTYDAVIGTNTVFVLVPFPIQDESDVVQQIKSSKKKVPLSKKINSN